MTFDQEVTSDHVPAVWMDYATHLPDPIPARQAEWALEDARNAWKRISDPEDQTLKISHDGYLKAGLTDAITFFIIFLHFLEGFFLAFL